MCRWSLPGEPVLLVVAEDLAVGSSGERGVDRRDVAAGVVASLATEDEAAAAHRGQAEVGEPGVGVVGNSDSTMLAVILQSHRPFETPCEH